MRESDGRVASSRVSAVGGGTKLRSGTPVARESERNGDHNRDIVMTVIAFEVHAPIAGRRQRRFFHSWFAHTIRSPFIGEPREPGDVGRQG